MKSFEQNVKNHYLKDRGAAYHLEKRKLSPERVPWVARLRAEKLQRFVNPSDTVFEYGVGAGWNLISLQCASKHAYDVSTLNKSSLERQGISFHENEDQLPRDIFDVVICHHVLEHVPYPGTTLCALRELLRDGGRLVLVVPQEFQHRPVYNPLDREGHLYTWTPQTLGNLVDRCGYEVEEMQVLWTGYDRFAAELAGRLKLPEVGFRLLRRAAQVARKSYEIVLCARRPDQGALDRESPASVRSR